MSVCTRCRQAMRQSLQTRPSHSQVSTFATTSHASSSPKTSAILAKPSWSIQSLLSSDSPTETITPSQLHHLLRLSALPLPKSPEEEDSMITTLQSQLRFVRAVQNVDTKGVEPLRAIRDETEEGVREATIGLDDLKEVLDKEEKVGYYQRARRTKGERLEEAAEKWDALGTASRRAGKFFVVDAGKRQKGEA